MESEKVLREAVLVLPVRCAYSQLEVLLGFKTAKIGAGCWNGPGGGIEANETPKEAARRELREEFNLFVHLRDLEPTAEIDFHDNPEIDSPFVCKVFVMLAWNCAGTPIAVPGQNIERPTWYPVNELPAPLMPADPHWLGKVLVDGSIIKATFHYGPYQRELLMPPGYDLATAVRRVGENSITRSLPC